LRPAEQPFPRHAHPKRLSLVRLLQPFDNVRQNGSFWLLEFFPRKRLVSVSGRRWIRCSAQNLQRDDRASTRDYRPLRGAADAISAVYFARNNGPSVSVRAGGQNMSGNAVCDRGLMIDRSRVRHPLGLPRNDRGGRGLTGPWNLSSEPTLG
jgi:hypothetical protein